MLTGGYGNRQHYFAAGKRLRPHSVPPGTELKLFILDVIFSFLVLFLNLHQASPVVLRDQVFIDCTSEVCGCSKIEVKA